MSEIKTPRLKLENHPEDKYLSPEDMRRLMAQPNEIAGLYFKVVNLRERELTQELISRINIFYREKIVDLSNLTNSKSGKKIRNYYFAMVYAILDHHKYGIANAKGDRLRRITPNKFENLFGVNRKTLHSNQDILDFYNGKRQNWKPELKYIFDEIEEEILRE